MFATPILVDIALYRGVENRIELTFTYFSTIAGVSENAGKCWRIDTLYTTEITA